MSESRSEPAQSQWNLFLKWLLQEACFVFSNARCKLHTDTLLDYSEASCGFLATAWGLWLDQSSYYIFNSDRLKAQRCPVSQVSGAGYRWQMMIFSQDTIHVLGEVTSIHLTSTFFVHHRCTWRVYIYWLRLFVAIHTNSYIEIFPIIEKGLLLITFHHTH